MALHVTLEFRGGHEGRTELVLPSEWAGQTHLERAVTELKAISDRTTIDDAGSPAERILRFPPNALVRISYVLVKDWKGPLNGNARFRADLEPDYFHLTGNNALVSPRFDNFAVVDAHFDWTKLPSQWSLGTSFGTGDRCQSFHGMWTQLVDALFVAGDYRIQHITVSGNAVDFAVRGKWTFTDDEWIRQAQKVIEFERTFWKDNNFPYLLITLTPLDIERGDTGGTALTNAFMMHLSRQDSLSYLVVSTLAHETFHAWNPNKMGELPEPEETESWFHEGFTVYYTDFMLFRAGLLAFPEYVQNTNNRLKEYETGAGRDLSNEEFTRLHSKDGSYDRLEYRRGAVLALWLDSTIRKESKNEASLDNLMFDLVKQEDGYEHSHKNSQLRLTTKHVLDAASKYLHANSRKLLQHYIEDGGSIPAQESALGSCTTLHDEAIPKFDLGFDQASFQSEKHAVFGVSSDSEAFRAGLRNGQHLAGWSFSKNDPFQQVQLTIKAEDGSKQKIQYYPQGAKVTVPQYRLDEAAYSANPERCISALRSP